MMTALMTVVCLFSIVLSDAQPYRMPRASSDSHVQSAYEANVQKMNRLLQFIRYYYVDTADFDKLVDKGISEMLKTLDPHSVYIPGKDVKRTNEALEGNFDGIGVQFQIVKDTIVVVEPLKGGPSEKVGIRAGDKIIRIDDSVATGKICTNSWVFKKLRGKKGTKVQVAIRRGKEEEPLLFTIIRDKIPIHCVESYFMIDDKTGYIQLERFAQQTLSEFRQAIRSLQEQGMENLIFDLRDNTGGYLQAAIDMVGEFLGKDQLVVFTKNNQSGNRMDYRTQHNGSFEEGRLVILINEYSASASEIVSGAVQDNDRGIIIGRRSFGKGLVQSQIPLYDSSVVRLTTSRYYIPSGRCIQKPYEDIENYSRDVINRYNRGELTHADSIHFPDSLKYKTLGGRVVYGGGGVMPDIFIPMDTGKVSDYYYKLYRRNIFNQFALQYANGNKAELMEKYPDFDAFYKNFDCDKAFMQEFYSYAEKEGVYDSADFNLKNYWADFSKKYKDTLNKMFPNMESVTDHHALEQLFLKYIQDQQADYRNREKNFDTEKYIKRQLRTLIARNLYGGQSVAKIWLEEDDTFQEALRVIRTPSKFRKMGIGPVKSR
ncbi:MAG: S41 family peptidase [Bacteroidales bacterium]|nr:S41 family peptidase [Bacteroidales bacterium]